MNIIFPVRDWVLLFNIISGQQTVFHIQGIVGPAIDWFVQFKDYSSISYVSITETA